MMILMFPSVIQAEMPRRKFEYTVLGFKGKAWA